jgi:hypothetical protein
MCHHGPNCRQTMHRCFGWLGSWAECVGGCCGGVSSSLGWLRKLCGIEPKEDIELLNMTQKNKNKKKIDRKEEPLQGLIGRKGKEKQKQKERQRDRGSRRELEGLCINYVL